MEKIIALSLSLLLLAVISFADTVIYADSADDGVAIKQSIRVHDPFGVPRPDRNAVNVPVRTSFYFQLYVDGDASDSVDLNSIEVQIVPEDEEPWYVIKKNQEFQEGYRGSITKGTTRSNGPGVLVFFDSDSPLKPQKNYTVKINAKTVKGRGIAAEDSQWSFTTAPSADTYSIDYSLDVSKPTEATWHDGHFFKGLLRATSSSIGTYGTNNIQRFDFIFSDEIREKYPNAWKLFKIRISGHDVFEPKGTVMSRFTQHVVREKETRRITSVTETPDGVLLKVEDFFGHEQYGIESNRPLSGDYKPGDEILIADASNDRRAFVISVNDAENTVLVTNFEQPAGGWLIDYFSEPPKEENPVLPGLFPKGGTYLYKFNPVGTPVYYWGRLDYVLGELHLKYGQPLIINFAEAPGDTSINGKRDNFPKDYVQFHKVIYDMTSHIIDRYGDATTTWLWSIFNEPDLSPVFRIGDNWLGLQKFYDYSVDAILRAFEDKGYDSEKVMVGGLELGGIFGTQLRTPDFLAHCSPTAPKTRALTLPKNAAYADQRLDGKRSRRVEELCSANKGEGSPLDFVSIHTYNSSEVGAAKIIDTKRVALETDPEYYHDLWINNFESMPDWANFFPGIEEWTWGNGYLPSWTADYFSRLLHKAAEDPRYSYGVSTFTLWPQAANINDSINDIAAIVKVRDGRTISEEVVAEPIFHYVNLVSTMKNSYWLFPQKEITGHTVSGFAAPGEDDYRLVLYSHNRYDGQSRSDDKFSIKLDLKGLEWDEVAVTEYQFDKENNTYYPFILEKKKEVYSAKEFEQLKEMTELKATNQTVYKVGDGGSVNATLSLAANGVNFVVVSEAKDETPPETPDITPTPTPSETPDETPTPSDTPDETPDETPTGTPGETPDESPTGNPSETPDKTPDETQAETPYETPDPTAVDPDESPTDKQGGEPSDTPPSTGDKGVIMMLLAFAMAAAVTITINLRKRSVRIG